MTSQTKESVVEIETLPDIDPALEKRLSRKIDRHVLPWLFGIFLFAYLDRANIGNAKIEGLPQDLHLTGHQLNNALTVFFVPYILVDIPSNWLLKKLRAGRYLSGLIMGFGIVNVCMGFTRNYAQLSAIRFMLGMFEGGIIGGVVLYLSSFYRRKELVLRIGIFYSAAPFSGAFGGFLATGLSHIQYGGYNRWPWIFFVEGSITVVFASFSWFFLPDSPETSSWLVGEEKELATLRVGRDYYANIGDAPSSHHRFSWHWVKIGILDVNAILASFAWLFFIVPLYSFAYFAPTIIYGLGYSPIISQLLTVPPNMTGFFMVLIFCALSDKWKARSPFLAVCGILAIIGYIMLLTGKTTSIQYGGTMFIGAGVYPVSPIITGWLANQMTPHYARASATGFQVSVGNLAAFIATFSYLPQDAPKYRLGHFVNIGALIIALILLGMNVVYIKWENGKRERGERDYRFGNYGDEWLGHRHPSYRYVL